MKTLPTYMFATPDITNRVKIIIPSGEGNRLSIEDKKEIERYSSGETMILIKDLSYKDLDYVYGRLRLVAINHMSTKPYTEDYLLIPIPDNSPLTHEYAFDRLFTELTTDTPHGVSMGRILGPSNLVRIDVQSDNKESLLHQLQELHKPLTGHTVKAEILTIFNLAREEPITLPYATYVPSVELVVLNKARDKRLVLRFITCSDKNDYETAPIQVSGKRI